jgi:cytochrome b561
MATQPQLALYAFGRWCAQPSTRVALYGCAAIFTVGVGVLGLVPTSSVLGLYGWRIAIHALFALLMCSLVFARYQWCVKYSAPTSPDDIQGLARHLSRIVYLLVYAVLGVRLIVSIASSIWHGATIDLDPFDKRFSSGSVTSDTDADFRQYLMACLVARAFVSVLAHKVWSATQRHPG